LQKIRYRAIVVFIGDSFTLIFAKITQINSFKVLKKHRVDLDQFSGFIQHRVASLSPLRIKSRKIGVR